MQRKLSHLGTEMTPEDVDAFMKSPIDLQDGISYHMKPIWEVISSALAKSMLERRLSGAPHHLQSLAEDHQRIINLQTYVEGVTLCPSITLGDWKVRELRATHPDEPDRTGYNCWNRRPGCRDDSACTPVGVVNLNCKCKSAGGCLNIGQDAYGIDMPVPYDGTYARSYEGANKSCERTRPTLGSKSARATRTTCLRAQTTTRGQFNKVTSTNVGGMLKVGSTSSWL
jgi:hypothetical protein